MRNIEMGGILTSGKDRAGSTHWHLSEDKWGVNLVSYLLQTLYCNKLYGDDMSSPCRMIYFKSVGKTIIISMITECVVPNNVNPTSIQVISRHY